MTKREKITQVIKTVNRTDFNKEISENNSKYVVEEFEKTITEEEKKADYYNDWSDERLGELAILNFKIMTCGIKNLEKANIKSSSMLCHMLLENNIEHFNISLNLSPITSNVAGHFISFDINKQTNKEYKNKKNNLEKEYTTKPELERQFIKSGLFDSTKELGQITRQLFDLFYNKTKDKEYADKKSCFCASFLLVSAIYYISANAENIEEQIKALVFEGKRIPNSGYKITAINKEIPLENKQQKQNRIH